MTTEAKHCLNCNAPLPDDAVYCPQCGQKDKDTRVSFFKIVREAVVTLLNLDSALFRTLPNLLIPGKLTLEFFKGRQKRYMNPVRLFLWITVILIALITIRTGEGAIQMNDALLGANKKTWELKQAMPVLDSAMANTQTAFPGRNLTPVFDSIRTFYERQLPTQRDTIDLNAIMTVYGEDSLKVGLNDMYELAPDSLLNEYQVTGFWNRIITKQKIKFLLDGKSFGVFFLGKLTWGILFLMPMLALGLKLLYIRRNFYYAEHLIFSIHTHTMVFLVFILALLAEPFVQDFGQLALILLPLSALYVLLAQKRFYRQKWGKTILKFLLIQLYYILILSVAMLVSFIIGFFLF
jgi:hypothetical protein